jgi:photosystem II stability/assembly factor-like uncharacterized protein
MQRGTVVAPQTLMSENFGRTWVPTNASRFTTAIVARDRQTMHAVAPINPGMFPGDFALMTTRDAGKTWTRSGNFPGTSPQDTHLLLIDAKTRSLIAVMNDSSILRSRDEGRSWQRQPIVVQSAQKTQ